MMILDDDDIGDGDVENLKQEEESSLLEKGVIRLNELHKKH
jgi:hypothetical protein